MNQIVTIIRRHWIPLLGLNSVLLAAITYIGVVSPRSWKASAQFILPVPNADLNANLGTLGNLRSGNNSGFSEQLNPITVQSGIITGDAVLSRVLTVDPEQSLYSNLANYKGLFEVIPQKQSPIMVVEAKGSSPDLAKRRIFALIIAYQQRLKELRRNDTSAQQQLGQEELAKALTNLNQAQNDLAKFQQSTGLIDSQEQTQKLIASINELKTIQATVTAESQANETQAKVAAAGLGMSPQQAMNSLRLGENKEYQVAREKLSQVETALADARSKYTNENPQVQSLLVQRQELLRESNQRLAEVVPNATEEIDTTLGGNGSRDSRIDMIAEMIRTQSAAKGQQQQANQLQSQVNKLSAELSSISKNQAQLADLQRKYEIAEGVYNGMTAQMQKAKIDTFNSYPNMQLLEGPIVDPKPFEPKLQLIAFGGILAAIFGSLALVLFLEARKPLLSPKDLQHMEFPVLGSISRLKRPDMERYLEADIEIDFQRLASAISCLMLEKHRLMVTSATFGEGKTTVTLGLALALVNFGFRVLVVDGDLRQAEMSRRLGHLKKIKPSSKQTPVSVYPGIDLIPAPPIPKNKIGEFFARGSFERCLSTIQDSGSYDYVLVDSAPVGLASETALMSEVVSNVLFVVRPATSDRFSVMDSLEQLTRHNARITGLVVNGVDSRTEAYRYYGRQRELLETEV